MSEAEMGGIVEAKPVLVPAAKRRRMAAVPVKKMPKKPSPRTVRGKIAAINAQMKENQEAVVKIEAGVRAIQLGINAQMKENQAYVRTFYG